MKRTKFIPEIAKYVDLFKSGTDRRLKTAISLEERREATIKDGEEMLTNREWTLALIHAAKKIYDNIDSKVMITDMVSQEVEVVDTVLKDLEKVSEELCMATICERGNEIERIKIAMGWQYSLDKRFMLPLESGKERKRIQGLDLLGEYYGRFEVDPACFNFSPASSKYYMKPPRHCMLLRGSCDARYPEGLSSSHRFFSTLVIPIYYGARPEMAIATRLGRKAEENKPSESQETK